MDAFFLIVLGLVLLFSFVILFGAPYLPTLKQTADDAFELLDLKKGQTLLELGSGDGRMLRMAAQKGIYAIGYELNPLLVLYTRITCFRYRKLVAVHCRNYFLVTLPRCDGIYVFLLDKFMPRLDKKISAELKSPVKVVSHAFRMPGKELIAQKNALFLYKY